MPTKGIVRRSSLVQDREQIDNFLRKNYRKFESPEYMFGVDNNQDSYDLWDTASLRVLCVFLSPGVVRGVSNTFTALNSLIKNRAGDRIFVDFAYFPCEPDMEMLTAAKIPLMFGNVSHRPAYDYDVVSISHAIMPEAFNLPHMLNLSGFPLSTQERLADPTLPLVLYGGASSTTANIVHGPIDLKEGGGSSLIDGAMFGYGEEYVDAMYETLADLNEQGPIKERKTDVLEYLLLSSDEHFYLPTAYEFEYFEGRDQNLKIKAINKVHPDAPDKVKIGRSYNTNFPGFNRKIMNLDGENSTSADIMISMGCSGEGACTFCNEGIIGGPFREKTLDGVREDMRKVKWWAAPNSVGFYSYNLNYYSKLFDLLGEAGKNFGQLSLINMRTDEISVNPDFLQLAKALGQIRISMAVEGMGNTMRNKMLNKNLQREQLMKAVRNVFQQRFILLKMGMIITGHETKEDIDEWLSELDEMLSIRDEVGARTAIQLSHTPLVHYDETPLRWLPRVTAKNSYEGNRTLHYYIEECNKRGIRTKFNGRGPGTFLEQLILDMGRAGTKVLVDVAINQGMFYYRHFGQKELEMITKALDRFDIDPTQIFRERDLDELSPSDTIEYVTPERIRRWKLQHKRRNWYMAYCLDSKSHKGKCFSCGTCETDEQILMITRRDITESPINVMIDNLSSNRPAHMTRMVVKVDPQWDFYDRTTMSHYITSLFLRQHDDILEAFFSVDKNTNTWASAHGQKGWFGGTFAFDVKWREHLPARKLKEFLEPVNKLLTAAQVVDIYDTSKELPIDTRGSVSYFSQIKGISMSQVKDRMSAFNWDIKVATKAMGGDLELEKKYMPELKDRILFVQHGETLLCYMDLPMVINPHLVIASIFNRPYRWALENFRFNTMDHNVPIAGTCDCGKQLGFSMLKDKASKFCPTCTGKRFLYSVTKGRATNAEKAKANN